MAGASLYRLLYCLTVYSPSKKIEPDTLMVLGRSIVTKSRFYTSEFGFSLVGIGIVTFFDSGRVL